jgi:hypothetical protein
MNAAHPANDARYATVGFIARDTLTMASGHITTTTWRPGVAGA